LPNDIYERCPGCMGPVEGSAAECPRCGYEFGAAYDPDYLRPGTTLSGGRYYVGELVAKNGEGATYLAYDNQGRKACWLREYFPTTLAARETATGEVHPLKGNGAQYKALMSDFADMAAEVRRFAITERVLPVTDCFNDNRTCYAVYARLKLITLESFLARAGGKLPLEQAMELLAPLFNTVGEIHDRGFIHRGISSQTVYVSEEGKALLWGFSLGAARTFGSELDSELFNGYSAPEQYSPSGWQGPWTDVYALAALVYRTVSGFVPPKSTLVGEERPLTKLSELAGIPANVSDAVAAAMGQKAEARTQSAYALLTGIVGAGRSNTAVFDTRRSLREQEEDRQRQRERREQRAAKDGGFKYALLALLFTVAALFMGTLYLLRTFFPDLIGGVSPEPSSESRSAAPLDLTGPDSVEGPLAGEGSVVPQEEKVPRCIGQTVEDILANDAYQERFEFSREESFNSDFPEGLVYAQAPDENVPVEQGGKTPVTLFISKGPEMAVMPDVLGMDYEEALKLLAEQRLACDRISRFKEGAAPNSVVLTSPVAGEPFDPQKVPVILYVMPGDAATGGTATSARPSAGTATDGD
jgi:serine/threonine-protein kinase